MTRGRRWTTAIALVLSGCTPSGGAGGATDVAAVPWDPADPGAYERSCDSRIYGSALHEQALPAGDVVGPVILAGLSETPGLTGLEPAPDGALLPLKFVTEVSADAVGPVLLSIAEADRSHARLIYDASEWDGGIAIADGDHTVALGVCEDRNGTGRGGQYNGGFIVAGPRCVGVRVVEAGLDVPPVERRVPFGVPDTDCR